MRVESRPTPLPPILVSLRFSSIPTADVTDHPRQYPLHPSESHLLSAASLSPPPVLRRFTPEAELCQISARASDADADYADQKWREVTSSHCRSEEIRALNEAMELASQGWSAAVTAFEQAERLPRILSPKAKKRVGELLTAMLQVPRVELMAYDGRLSPDGLVRLRDDNEKTRDRTTVLTGAVANLPCGRLTDDDESPATETVQAGAKTLAVRLRRAHHDLNRLLQRMPRRVELADRLVSHLVSTLRGWGGEMSLDEWAELRRLFPRRLKHQLRLERPPLPFRDCDKGYTFRIGDVCRWFDAVKRREGFRCVTDAEVELVAVCSSQSPQLPLPDPEMVSRRPDPVKLSNVYRLAGVFCQPPS